MRIIKEKTLKDKCLIDRYQKAESHLKAWIREIEKLNIENPNQLKEIFRNASIITNKRVVFNIKGNDFRLIVDIEYKLNFIFIVWFGTHEEYNKIDAKLISYEN